MRNYGRGVAGSVLVVLVFFVSSVSAARLESPSYRLDTNLGGSFSGQSGSTSYKMESIGGEAIVGNGSSGSYKLSQQVAPTDTPSLALSLPDEPIALGTIASGVSRSSNFNVDVQANTDTYSLSIQQDHDLQKADASATIPAIAATTAIPQMWNEGSTKGLGYSIVSAPQLDAKWDSGARFAAFPGTNTTFYNGLRGTYSLTMRARLDIALQQSVGDYTNTVTVSGVITP